jgi:hypothetical protein
MWANNNNNNNNKSSLMFFKINFAHTPRNLSAYFIE